MAVLRATTFKDSERSFLEALEKNEIEYRLVLPPIGPQASGLTIEIIISGGWGTLAVACLAWAYARKSRRINIVTKDNQSVWLEGYPADEAEKILESAMRIVAIDTKPADKMPAERNET